MTARKPRVGEVWSTAYGGDPRFIVVAEPDPSGYVVVKGVSGTYYLTEPRNLRPPKLTLDDLPPIPEYWVNVHSNRGPCTVWNRAEDADSQAPSYRIARVRLVPDPDSIIECDGRTVL